MRFFHTMTKRRLLEWEQLAVVEILAEAWVETDFDYVTKGRWVWANDDAILIVARQNGKGDVLLCIELYLLFVLRCRRVHHTAQLQRTASDAWKRMADVIRESPKLFAQLDRGEFGIRKGKGDEGIVLSDGSNIIFYTRSDNAGRGLFGDALICDEAYDLTENELAAIVPLIKTGLPSPLIIYASTPVDQDSMPHGYVLAGLRKKALHGSPRITLLEWSIPEHTRPGRDPRLTDRHCRALSNPSLNIPVPGRPYNAPLVTMEILDADLRRMGPRKFLVEDLCAPDYWPDPEETDLEDMPFPDVEAFSAQVRGPEVPFVGRVALGLDRSHAGKTALVAAGWFEDGAWGTETIYHKEGSEWPVPTILDLIEWFEPAVLVMDATGPAGAYLAPLLAAGIEPVVTGISDMGRACGGLVDSYTEGAYFHRGLDTALLGAVDIVRWRDLGDAKAFARKGHGDISPVVGAALAGLGLRLAVAFGETPKPGMGLNPSTLPPDQGAELGQGSFGDLAGVGF